MKHQRTLVLLALLSLSFSSKALSDGMMGFPSSGYDSVSDFLTGYLTGPRIDPYWDEDSGEANVPALNERIFLVEDLLGPAGYPLANLREDLDLGMNRGQYELGAYFTIREVRQLLIDQPGEVKVYRGFVDQSEVKYLLRWLPNGYVNGMYYHAPARGNQRIYTLHGHNHVEGRLYFVETTDLTQTAKISLQKRITDEEIVWEGLHHGSNDRRSPMAMWRPQF